MSYTTAILFFASVVLSFYNVRAVNVSSWGESYDAYVVNGLPDNKYYLRIHVFSGDDDLGYHNLLVNENFHWRFKMKFPGVTKFFGHFWWIDKEAGFPVFDGKISSYHCGSTGICYWLVKEDGFYIANKMKPSPEELVKKHGWD